MAKITSKLQVTVPKLIAEQYGIRPGGEIQWIPAGDAIRVVPGAAILQQDNRAERMALFDQATDRLKHRHRKAKSAVASTRDRGWTREDLYDRGGSR
jgi:bifunctional DNA-binding transcriptional regulator/antitoxin component of YhaV-PrlF toxin-antitoxin module